MSFARKTLFAFTGSLVFAGFAAVGHAEEAAPKPEEAKPAETPAAAPEKLAAKDAYVVVDGVRYNWEEAVRKFPDMKATAPANLVFDPDYKSSPETAPKPAAETVAAPEAKPADGKKAAEEQAKKDSETVKAADKASEKAEKEAAEKAEKAEEEKKKAAEKAEKEARKKAEKAEKEAKKKAAKGEPAAPALVEPDPAYAQKMALVQARARVELEDRIQKHIRHLGGEHWKEARAELIAIGKDAVPYLIDAMAPADQPVAGEPPLAAYAAGQPARPTRTRPLSDIAFECLDAIIRSHSDWKGAVPGLDQKAWQSFWADNGAGIKIGSK
ncbi:MAG: hypothetical protein KIS92_04020 [Planctomycetota bacterium]|nr:hypothetical protein [Planctomycetota bacterium]